MIARTSQVLIAAAMGAALLAGGGLWLERSNASSGLSLAAVAQEAGAQPDAADVLPDMVMGEASAPITVIEYASYTCSHCARFHDEVFPRLKAEYIDSGQVKFILREVYFEKFGLWAGMLARCGGEDKYYPLSGMIFHDQRAWIGEGTEASIAEGLRKQGRKAGLTPERIEECLADADLARSLVTTYQATASADEIDATPTFIINGEKYSNMPWTELKKVIDEKLGAL
ncbi:DsbA family protein [Phaeovulum vinaykumarii]|uniref:Protein-disulfide isomerase n=1 Tax=Phaeovulum vinaykumarii TaxID=407234 RepID=A0A1N7L0B3_9RHOB|nr:DsbA family protein [Phaeovulum vinaykumarii]SIS67273.1 Protein-disulfide isomerase [Phaeovulum vinaykumarii]SOC00777.1 protein-disulfide isomerase [Phaeovulum vinaykumarii]